MDRWMSKEIIPSTNLEKEIHPNLRVLRPRREF